MQFRRIVIIGLVLLGLTCLNLGSEATSMAVAKTKSYKLDNGLTVIAKHVDAAPVVSVFIWYQVGARNEPAGQSGLAHFLEHMLFKGTKQFGKGEVARLVARTGGHQNAFTSYDYTAYFETVPSEHIDLALEIEADRMRNAIINTKEVEAERTVILSELDGNQNHPQVRLRELVNAQTWINHPYRRPVIGWKHEVQKLTAKQLKAFYDQHYRPQNATLVVVGSFDSMKLKHKIQRLFGSIKPGPKVEQEVHLAEKTEGTRRVMLNDFGPAKMLQVNLQIPPAGHKDHFPITVLNDALVKGRSSRLYKALVDTGLAINVSASPYEMIDNGHWTFTVTCSHDTDLDKIESILFKEMNILKQELLSKKEFERSVNQTKAQLIYSKDSLTDQAMLLGFYQTVAGDYKLPDNYPEKVAAVKRSTIQQVAKTYLDTNRMTIGRFIPKNGKGAASPVRDTHVQHFSPWDRLIAKKQAAKIVMAGQSRPISKSVKSSKTFKHLVLDNGLTFIVQSNPSNPMIVVSGIVEAGLIHEPADQPGLSFAHSRLLDKGTQKRSGEVLAEDLEFKGAELSFNVQPEHLSIHGEALSEDYSLLLSALAECLVEPSFPEGELKKVKKKLIASCRHAKDNANLQAWQGFYNMAYPEGHPMRRSLITAESGIDKVTRKAISDYHRNWVQPQRTVISLSGDIDPESACKLITTLFAKWKTHSVPDTIQLSEMKPVTKTKMRSELMEGKRESIVVLGQEGIHRLHEDYYKLFVANHVLGGSGLSSQLMRIVRDEHGLTYSIYSYFKLSKYNRPWCLVFQADPKKVPAAIDLSLKQVQYLQKGKIGKKWLDDSKEQLVGRLVISLETNSGIAYLNREIQYHQLGWDYLKSYPQAIRDVSFKDMLRVAKKWYHPDKMIISVAGPKTVDVKVENKRKHPKR